MQQPTTSSIRPIEPSTVNRSHNMDRNPHFDIKKTLMSPPEFVSHDTFGRSPTMTNKPHGRPLFPKEMFPMSPPISPDCRPDNSPEDSSTRAGPDPILFPPNELHTPQAPLFNENEALEAQKVVDGHVAARESSMFREASPPRQSEYQLAVEFKSQVAKSFNADRQQWLRRERQYLMEDKALQSRLIGLPRISERPMPNKLARLTSTRRASFGRHLRRSAGSMRSGFYSMCEGIAHELVLRSPPPSAT